MGKIKPHLGKMFETPSVFMATLSGDYFVFWQKTHRDLIGFDIEH